MGVIRKKTRLKPICKLKLAPQKGLFDAEEGVLAAQVDLAVGDGWSADEHLAF
jgi:hypothetical protein